MKDFKHIHVLAQDDSGSSLDKETSLGLTAIVLTYKSDGSGVSEEYKNFEIPKDQSKLKRFIDDTYSSTPPTNISKLDFLEKIYDYTINIINKNPIYGKLNAYYYSLTNSPESQNQIKALFSNKTFAPVQAEIDNREKQKKENLNVFEAAMGNAEQSFDSLSDELNVSPEKDVEDEAINDNPPSLSPEEKLKQDNIKLFGDKPTEGNMRPVRQMENLSAEKTQTISNLDQNAAMMLKGTGGSRLIEPVIEPVIYDGDAYLKSENNSGILCSRDELYRPRAHTQSGAVYIYAGRKGSSKSENATKNLGEAYTNKENKKGPEPNNLITDSAYIYISQKADVDSLYQYKVARGNYSKVIAPILKKGERETRRGFSLVSMKADDILLMSRSSGIRLVTGTDKKKSDGGDQSSKFGIDLIAGNDDASLQPLVKGDNLVTYLTRLSETVDKLRSVVYDFMNSQSKFNNQVATHTHYDPFLMMCGTLGPKNPLAIDIASVFGAPAGGGKCPPSTELKAAGTAVLLETIKQQANVVNLIMGHVANDTNAFNGIGAYNILSDRNRTN